MTDTVLVIGACGQLGIELTHKLRGRFGEDYVIASDLAKPAMSSGHRYEVLDVLDRTALGRMVQRHQVTHIYMLAAALSARGEQEPAWAWDLNMRGLLNVLEVAVEAGVSQVFWPSSIAAFGPSSARASTPQTTPMDPTTVYGISKLAGERWCAWYHRARGLDVRSLRFPGLLSSSAPPGGGTTDYAVDIFRAARQGTDYECFLSANRRLPMMYIEDAVRATIELMDASTGRIRERSSYNLSAISFTPAELAVEIAQVVPGFAVRYQPDFRDAIAASWPESIDDSAARHDWGWRPRYDVAAIVREMLRSDAGQATADAY